MAYTGSFQIFKSDKKTRVKKLGVDSKNRRHGGQRVGNFRYLDICFEVFDKAMSALVTPPIGNRVVGVSVSV